MSDSPQTQPPGWYYAQGDPPGTQRYWDGSKWEGGPQPVPGLGGDSPVGVGGASGSDLGEPLSRILARLIDWVLWFAVAFVVGLIFGAGIAATGGDDISTGASIIAGLLGLIIVVAYEVFLVANTGQTLGKMALNLKVVKADRSPADLPTAFRRMLPYIVLTLVGSIIPVLGIITLPIAIIIGLVSLVFLFTDAQRQTVWDKVGGTIVVSTK